MENGSDSPRGKATENDEKTLGGPLSGSTRREFLLQTGTAAVVMMGAPLFGQAAAMTNATAPLNDEAASAVDVLLRINGHEHRLRLDPRVTLLDALRERLGLPGTKKGCDHGQCGACTVLIDGRRINSCLALAVMYDGAEITTIEGLAQGQELHPMQTAFLKHDGLQCGYCTCGQICSAVAMLREHSAGAPSVVTPMATLRSATARPELTDEEIRERMSGNLCRCGAYSGIRAAIREVAG